MLCVRVSFFLSFRNAWRTCICSLMFANIETRKINNNISIFVWFSKLHEWCGQSFIGILFFSFLFYFIRNAIAKCNFVQSSHAHESSGSRMVYTKQHCRLSIIKWQIITSFVTASISYCNLHKLPLENYSLLTEFIKRLTQLPMSIFDFLFRFSNGWHNVQSCISASSY